MDDSQIQKENPDTLNHLMSQLNDRAKTLYRFVNLYNGYLAKGNDYGFGQPVSMVEIHTVSTIADHPGIHVTELSRMWNRTNGAASQILNKLETKGYIEKRKQEGNAKQVCLYVTEAGQKLDRAHKAYDIVEVTQIMQDLLEDCTAEEVDAFYKVMGIYTKLLENKEKGDLGLRENCIFE